MRAHTGTGRQGSGCNLFRKKMLTIRSVRITQPMLARKRARCVTAQATGRQNHCAERVAGNIEGWARDAGHGSHTARSLAVDLTAWPRSNARTCLPQVGAGSVLHDENGGGERSPRDASQRCHSGRQRATNTHPRASSRARKRRRGVRPRDARLCTPKPPQGNV